MLFRTNLETKVHKNLSVTDCSLCVHQVLGCKEILILTELTEGTGGLNLSAMFRIFKMTLTGNNGCLLASDGPEESLLQS